MPRMPIEWSQIFSQAVLDVKKRLNVDIYTDPKVSDNCLFIRVKPGGRYKISVDSAGNIVIEARYDEYSTRNNNVTGWDYYEYEKQKEITLSTWIGLCNNWYNVALFPKMLKLEQKNDPKSVSKLCSTYPGIIFERKYRYTRKHYRHIGNYDSLIDYLNDVIASGIRGPGLFDLEVLVISTPPINLESILKKNGVSLVELKNQIEFHVKLMLLTDYIYQH